jgi:hypothetical protein
MDLSNQKGYGKKKGGRKMIPHDRPMPMLMDDMAYIQPYGLQAPQMLEGMGEEMTPYLKDIFPFGVPKFRGKGKKMKGGYLTSLFNVMGRGDNMKGCGKIGGQYVSSEFEDEYLNNLANILNQKQMSVLQSERQFEQQIQKQMNMEQQNALAQLQYYDLLNKVQQPRPQF